MNISRNGRNGESYKKTLKMQDYSAMDFVEFLVFDCLIVLFF